MNEEQTNTNPTPRLDTWPRRRRMMHIVLTFCMAVIGFCLWKEPTHGDTAIEYSFIVIGLTVLGYVFGAILDDNAVTLFKRK